MDDKCASGAFVYYIRLSFIYIYIVFISDNDSDTSHTFYFYLKFLNKIIFLLGRNSF